MNSLSLLRSIHNYFFRHYVFRLIGLSAIVILFVALGSAIPYLFGILIDMMINHRFEDYASILILYVALNFIITLIGIVKERLQSIFIYKVSSQIKEKIYSRIVYMKCISRERYATGELIQRIQGDSEGIVTFYTDTITSILSIIFNLGVSVYFIIRISPFNAMISIINIPLIFLLNKIFKKSIEKVLSERKMLDDKNMSFLHNSIDNYTHIKIFSLEKELSATYKEFVWKGLDILKKNHNISDLMGIIKGLINLVITYSLFFVFALLIQRGMLTIGQMVSYNTYIARLYDAISKISSININSIGVKISLERIEQIENECSEESFEEFEDARYMPSPINSIELRNVSFSYSSREYVLNNISMDFSKAGFYTLVGKNGSGKTTVFKLITKMFETDEKAVFINNLDILDLPHKYLRNEIVYVSKDVYIKDGSIRDNLFLANTNATYEDAVNSCMRVGLHDDICSFEMGYDSILGTDGIQLSSGQRQKLNFARALIRKGSVFILDEATSDLDGIAEQDFIYNIKRLAAEHIVILITHKVSSVIHSDKIFVMSEGAIVDAGTHNELLRKSELYWDMFNSCAES